MAITSIDDNKILELLQLWRDRKYFYCTCVCSNTDCDVIIPKKTVPTFSTQIVNQFSVTTVADSYCIETVMQCAEYN